MIKEYEKIKERNLGIMKEEAITSPNLLNNRKIRINRIKIKICR